MRILFVSDPPNIPGAYGIQGGQLAGWLHAHGHPVLYFGTTYYGAPFEHEGVPVVGGASRGDLFGDTLIAHYAAQHEADLIVTLKDVHVYSPEALRRMPRPWVPIVPIDTEPLSIMVKNQLAYATLPVALTRGGQQMLAAEGIRAGYAPHAIDTGFWCPGDRAAARDRLGLPQGVFVAAFVGANNDRPSRKSLDQILLSWAIFLEQSGHSDAVLYLHTSLSTHYGGVNVKGLIETIQLSPANLRATNQAAYDTGSVPPEMVRDIYRAADVLVNPSMGGGFELCGVEAQACGTPVITCEFTAMRETVGAGWRIPLGPNTGETVWSSLGAFRMRPTRLAIVEALKRAAAARDDQAMRETALAFAQRYSTDTVYDTYWPPIMAELEALLVRGELEPERELA